jgi:hypothetical protein
MAAATQGKTQQAHTKIMHLQKSIQYQTHCTQYTIIYADMYTIIGNANETKEKEKLSERSVTVYSTVQCNPARFWN